MHAMPAPLTLADETASGFRRSPLRGLTSWLDRRLFGLFLVPGIACLSIVIVYPIAYNVVVAFTDASLIYPGIAFVGLEHFEVTLADTLFWTAAMRRLQWTVLSVACQLLVGFAAALALERITRGRTGFRLALIVPWAFPAIVMAFGWRFMLDPLYGVVNHLLMLTGLIAGPIAPLSERALAMP